MKIAFVYEKFVCSGGAEAYLVELSRQFEALGCEMTYITMKADGEVREKLHGRFMLLPRPPGSGVLRHGFFARAAARAVESGCFYKSVGFGRTYAQDVHRAGGGSHRHYTKLLPVWKRVRPKTILELFLERRLYTGGKTKQFVVNSSKVAREIAQAYNIAPDAIRTLYTPVDAVRFRPSDDREAGRFKVCLQTLTAPASKILLFVSLGHRRKGLDCLLRALARDRRAVLWIVGSPLSFHYKSLISRLNLWESVRVIPPQLDVVKFYQAADWFVHPTLYDPCANTVLQSMACGLPGIISSQDGASDHLADERNGLLLDDPTDSGELASTISRALKMPEEKRAEMGQNARKRVQTLTWDRHVREWMELLEAPL